MCEEIFCTCEVHDILIEEARAKDPDYQVRIRKAYLLSYGRRYSLRPVCELCEEFVDKPLMGLELAKKHRDLSRGRPARPRSRTSDSAA